MTVTEGDHREDDVHHPASIACEEVGCCGDDHSEDHVADEVESHCGGGCCGDDEDSDCDSDVDHCDDSCCGPCEDQDVHEEPTCGTGMTRLLPAFSCAFSADRAYPASGGCCAAGSPDSESVHSSCCIPAIGGDEEVYTPGKCIPDGVNGCQRAALLKSTCCGSHANSVPGTVFSETLVAGTLNVNCHRNPFGSRRSWGPNGLLGRNPVEGAQVYHSRALHYPYVFSAESYGSSAEKPHRSSSQ